MKLLDVDGDGVATKSFVQAGNTSMYDVTEDVEDEEADAERTAGLLQKVWERVDEDGSGTLDRDEVAKVLIQMGLKHGSESAGRRHGRNGRGWVWGS